MSVCSKCRGSGCLPDPLPDPIGYFPDVVTCIYCKGTGKEKQKKKCKNKHVK